MKNKPISKPPTPPANSETERGSHDATCSAWLDPQVAPKDGTVIIADFGWPWAVPAIWDPVDETWATAQLSPSAPDESVGWETEWEPHKNLKRWIPIPFLPNVEVCYSDGAEGGTTGAESELAPPSCCAFPRNTDSHSERSFSASSFPRVTREFGK